MFREISIAIVCILLSSSAQLLMKRGLVAVKQADITSIYMAALASPFVWMGLFLYGASAVIWLWVLAKIDVGLAYPLVGLGLVITHFAGIVYLNETFSWTRLLGCALILLGITVLALQHKA